jgi:hypothetical protein
MRSTDEGWLPLKWYFITHSSQEEGVHHTTGTTQGISNQWKGRVRGKWEQDFIVVSMGENEKGKLREIKQV